MKAYSMIHEEKDERNLEVGVARIGSKGGQRDIRVVEPIFLRCITGRKPTSRTLLDDNVVE